MPKTPKKITNHQSAHPSSLVFSYPRVFVMRGFFCILASSLTHSFIIPIFHHSCVCSILLSLLQCLTSGRARPFLLQAAPQNNRGCPSTLPGFCRRTDLRESLQSRRCETPGTQWGNRRREGRPQDRRHSEPVRRSLPGQGLKSLKHFPSVQRIRPATLPSDPPLVHSCSFAAKRGSLFFRTMQGSEA
jgi:hypothetical protein